MCFLTKVDTFIKTSSKHLDPLLNIFNAGYLLYVILMLLIKLLENVSHLISNIYSWFQLGNHFKQGLPLLVRIRQLSF